MVYHPRIGEARVREKPVALINRMIDELLDGAEIKFGREMPLPIFTETRLRKEGWLVCQFAAAKKRKTHLVRVDVVVAMVKPDPGTRILLGVGDIGAVFLAELSHTL